MEEQNTISYSIPKTSPSQPGQLHNSAQPFQIPSNWDPESEKCDKDKMTMFVCNLCMKTFYNQIALQNHKNVTHDVHDTDETPNWNTFTNKIEMEMDKLCGFKFIPLNSEDLENNNAENSIITRCFNEDTSYLLVKVDDGELGNYYNDKIALLDRQQKVLGNAETTSVDLRGPFTCTLPSTMCPELQCRQTFISCCEYSLHYREKHTKRRKSSLRCQVCEKRLEKGSSATKMRLVDEYHVTSAIMFPCRMCGQQFPDQAKCEEHNRLMHAKMKPHQCSICYKRFAQLGGLQQHLRMHTGIRPFVCTFCSKAFTQKAGLDQHLRIHTKVKPFKCVVCSKCFSQSVHLRQHMRTHTNIQPFECSVCEKRFKQRSHLNFHLRSHVNEHFDAARRFESVMRRQGELDFKFQPTDEGENLYYSESFSPSRAKPYDSPPGPDNAAQVKISKAYNEPPAPAHDRDINMPNLYYNPPVSFHSNVNIPYYNYNQPVLASAANISIPYDDNVQHLHHAMNVQVPNTYDTVSAPLCSANVNSNSFINAPLDVASYTQSNINMPSLYDNPLTVARTANISMPLLYHNPPGGETTVDMSTAGTYGKPNMPENFDHKPPESICTENVTNPYDTHSQNMLPLLEPSAPPV
ncbi:hypothetical protein O0L34_g2769 [Tuta absoluta]|nr:hypothetical protein O0L34_g2769 [Tuta absoluta]